MTLETGFFGILVDEHLARTAPVHHVMAFVAGDIRHLVHASLPVQIQTTFVALQTDAAFLPGLYVFKGNDRGELAVEIRLQMFAQRTVTQFAGFGARIAKASLEFAGMFGFQEGPDVTLVALEAIRFFTDGYRILEGRVELSPVHLVFGVDHSGEKANYTQSTEDQCFDSVQHEAPLF